MAEVTARVTYRNSRRQFVIRRSGADARLSIERTTDQDKKPKFVLATYSTRGKPLPGVGGIKLEMDEETAQEVITGLLSAIFAR